jgi:hypothetical protein
MSAQDLFKDVQIMTLSNDTADTTINNDESVVVYIDEDEEDDQNEDENHPMNVKIEVSDNDEDSNQSMVVEPDDQVVANEVSIKGENSDNEDNYSINEICLKYELSDVDFPQKNVEDVEEQFELIEEKKAENEDTLKENDTTEEGNQKTAITADENEKRSEEKEETSKENEENQAENNVSALTENNKEQESPDGSRELAESFESNEHDYCYSQSNYYTPSIFCENLIENILTQHKSNPVELLSAFTSELTKYDSAESVNSLSQIIQTLNQTLLIKCDSTVEDAQNKSDESVETRFENHKNDENLKDTPLETLVNENNEGAIEVNEVPLKETFSVSSFWGEDNISRPNFNEIFNTLDSQKVTSNQNEDGDVKMEEQLEIFKEEPIEQEALIRISTEIVPPKSPVKEENEAGKLKSHIENASSLTKIMSESFCDLESLVRFI